MDSCYATQNSLSGSHLSAWPEVNTEDDVIMSFAGSLSGHAYTAVTSEIFEMHMEGKRRAAKQR